MCGDEQDEGVAWVDVLADPLDRRVERRGGGVLVDGVGDARVLVEASGRLLHRRAERLGILAGEAQATEILAGVSIDADGENVQLRPRPVGRPGELDRRARGERGQQIAAVVGDDLDDVVARVEGQLLGLVTGCPVALSERRTTPPASPDSRRVRFGENPTDRSSLRCPSKVRTRRPVAASHNFIVSSRLPDSTRASREHAAEKSAEGL